MQKNFEYLSPQRVHAQYELPLNEIVLGFLRPLEKRLAGYGSLDYHLAGYAEGRSVKLDRPVGGEPWIALACLPPRIYLRMRRN